MYSASSLLLKQLSKLENNLYAKSLYLSSTFAVVQDILEIDASLDIAPCYKYGKRGHFAEVCKKQASSVRNRSSVATLTSENLSPKKLSLLPFLQVLLIALVLQLFN